MYENLRECETLINNNKRKLKETVFPFGNLVYYSFKLYNNFTTHVLNWRGWVVHDKLSSAFTFHETQ